MKVTIEIKRLVHDGFLSLETALIKFQKIDGTMSEPVVRENCWRADSAAALVYDLNEKKVILVRQFRYPVFTVEPEEAWLLELPAGSITEGEDPKDAVMRELLEEVHIDVRREDVRFVGKCFSSPGGTSERIYIYAVECDLSDYDKKIGGVAEEHEDIQILLMPFRQVYEELSNEKIMDAKTILALQWLEKQVNAYVFGV